MKTPTDAAADGQTTASSTDPASSLQLLCKVLINGTVHAGSHHAAGKEMAIPKDAAEFLVAQTPPAVEILGTV